MILSVVMYTSMVLAILFVVSVFIRNYLPKWYTCDLMHWHGKIDIREVGVITKGVCTKCKREVMRDSQGNWF